MLLDNSPETLHRPGVSLHQRRAVDGDFIAELDDLCAVEDIAVIPARALAVVFLQLIPSR